MAAAVTRENVLGRDSVASSTVNAFPRVQFRCEKSRTNRIVPLSGILSSLTVAFCSTIASRK
jgi:hypothetical protein